MALKDVSRVWMCGFGADAPRWVALKVGSDVNTTGLATTEKVKKA